MTRRKSDNPTNTTVGTYKPRLDKGMGKQWGNYKRATERQKRRRYSAVGQQESSPARRNVPITLPRISILGEDQ